MRIGKTILDAFFFIVRNVYVHNIHEWMKRKIIKKARASTALGRTIVTSAIGWTTTAGIWSDHFRFIAYFQYKIPIQSPRLHVIFKFYASHRKYMYVNDVLWCIETWKRRVLKPIHICNNVTVIYPCEDSAAPQHGEWRDHIRSLNCFNLIYCIVCVIKKKEEWKKKKEEMFTMLL